MPSYCSCVAPACRSATNFTIDVRSRWDGNRKRGEALSQRGLTAGWVTEVLCCRRCSSATGLLKGLCRRPVLSTVLQELERSIQSVCQRRGLSCRLHLKNEAAAVEADPGVVQVRMGR